MSEAIATRESVAGAVATLEASGSKVTAAAVRSLLGGGSQLSITTHLREIRMGGNKPTIVEAYPEALLAALDSLKAAVWKAAREAAVRSFEDERTQLLRFAAADQSELSEAAMRIDALEAENMRLENVVAGCEKESQELAQQLSEKATHQRMLEKENAALLSQNRELLSKFETQLANRYDGALVMEEIRRINLLLHKRRRIKPSDDKAPAAGAKEEWRQMDLEDNGSETQPSESSNSR